MAVTIKPGDDIHWTGTLTQAGVADFTNYTLTSEIRSRSAVTGVMSALQATAVIEWTDPVLGVFSYRVSRAVTALWPADATLYLDVRVESPDGSQVRTATAEFKTAQGVTA